MTSTIARVATDMAWSLWKELGVPGVVRMAHPPSLDLEWLIVHTPFLCSDEPRLDELAFGWCVHNYAWVNTRRLRSVADRVERDIADPFWAWASELRSLARINWVDAGQAVPSTRFVRRLSPDLDRPALAALRARAAFGVGARADLVCALLAGKGRWFRASDLVDVGYTKSTVAAVVADLTRIHVLAAKQQGNATVYVTDKVEHIEGLLRTSDVSWFDWPHVFEFVTSLMRLETESGKPEAVLRVSADHVRRKLAESVVALEWPEMPGTVDVTTGHQDMLQWGKERLEDLSVRFGWS